MAGIMSKKDLTNPITINIKRLIEQYSGGRVTDFAQKVGINDANYYVWVNRDSAPDAETQRKICNAYGVSMEWLGEHHNPDTPIPIQQVISSTPQPQQPVVGTDLLSIILSQQETIKEMSSTIKELSTSLAQVSSAIKDLSPNLAQALSSFQKLESTTAVGADTVYSH